VQTLLQAHRQIPEVSIAYGPDTYMGANLAVMLARLGETELLSRFSWFRQGTCIVHHLFGDEIVRRVKADYADALLTAHLEVPGEMFALAADAEAHGRGVVGSTSNILGFIEQQVDAAVTRPGAQHVPVVLGTEAGMVTSIVDKVQASLRARHRSDVDVEIIFPVASEAVAAAPGPLGVVPGVAGGEGCSTAGGCATCPFMKMNTLEALEDVLALVGTPEEARLAPFRPRTWQETIEGRSIADLGTVPILHMRHFQRTGVLPEALVADVRARGAH
jgi:quinolinate synthase